MLESLFIHEDDWGMISIVPVENADQVLSVTAEVRAFAERHRTPGGIGWTDIYVLPEEEFPLSARAIPTTELQELFGFLVPVGELVTGYGTYREPLAWAFAFMGGPYSAIFGLAPQGIVRELHFTGHRPDLDLDTDRLANALHAWGSRHRLILVDWWLSFSIDLTDLEALRRYLFQQCYA
jgi:hypothetical protein